VGLDVSPAMLARARDRLAPRGVALVTGDVEALPCRDQSFDAATGHFVLVFLDRPGSGSLSSTACCTRVAAAP
jgi:ubiquinone/menaquinone biosynthesis C-methylase UbiE